MFKNNRILFYELGSGNLVGNLEKLHEISSINISFEGSSIYVGGING